MYKSLKTSSGFTMMEVLVVVAIIGVISIFAFIGFKNFSNFQQFSQTVSNVEFSLNKTRLSARSAEGDSSHGIKFNSDSIVIFAGDSYSAADPDNQTIDYQLVTLSVSLTGGVDEVVFAKLTGRPSATGTITINGVDYADSTTIELSGSGVIQ